jgi:hypothetical protein
MDRDDRVSGIPEFMIIHKTTRGAGLLAKSNRLKRSAP